MPAEHPTHQYCSRCASPLVVKVVKPGDLARPVCTACGLIVYLDPKVAVGTIIRGPDSQVALVRRAIEPGYGKWVFPGGYVDRGEELLVAAEREAWEESRLRIRIDGLVNIYSYAGRVPVIIVYAATQIGGALSAADESLDARWFGKSDLPWEDLAFQSTLDGLRDYFRGILYPHAI